MLSQSVWQDTVNIQFVLFRVEEKKGNYSFTLKLHLNWSEKKSQMSSAISDTMIFIKELKSLLNGGEPGERFYFVSWGKDSCIKIIQLSRADISVQNNSLIAVFIFCGTHSSSLSFILKGPVIPSVSYNQTH